MVRFLSRILIIPLQATCFLLEHPGFQRAQTVLDFLLVFSKLCSIKVEAVELCKELLHALPNIIRYAGTCPCSLHRLTVPYNAHCVYYFHRRVYCSEYRLRSDPSPTPTSCRARIVAHHRSLEFFVVRNAYSSHRSIAFLPFGVFLVA